LSSARPALVHRHIEIEIRNRAPRGRHEHLARHVEQCRDDAQIGHVGRADLTINHDAGAPARNRPLLSPLRA
jgi:hypothetical protein